MVFPNDKTSANKGISIKIKAANVLIVSAPARFD